MKQKKIILPVFLAIAIASAWWLWPSPPEQSSSLRLVAAQTDQPRGAPTQPLATSSVVLPPSQPSPPPVAPTEAPTVSRQATLDAFQTSPPPVNGADLIMAYSSRLLARGRLPAPPPAFGANGLGQGQIQFDPAAVKARALIRYFDLDLAAFASGQGMNAAYSEKRILYVFEADGAIIGCTYLEVNSDGTPLPITGGLSTGVEGINMASALNELAAMPQIQSGSYEPRLLRLPPIGNKRRGYQVIWLKSVESNADLIYVMKSTFNDLPGFQQGELVTAQDFIKIWQPQVQDRLAHPPPPLPEAPSGAGG